MDGIGGFIATMSIGLSQANTTTQASLAMLKNNMEASEAMSDKLIESISESVPSAGGNGALMDVRA